MNRTERLALADCLMVIGVLLISVQLGVWHAASTYLLLRGCLLLLSSEAQE